MAGDSKGGPVLLLWWRLHLHAVDGSWRWRSSTGGGEGVEAEERGDDP